MVATASARSVAVSCCAARGMSGACSRHANASERVDTRIIYLLLFVAPQALLYLYLRERLPDPAVRGRARARRAVRRVQPSLAVRGPARAARGERLGRGPRPVHGSVDRVAALGMDLLRPSHDVRGR